MWEYDIFLHAFIIPQLYTKGVIAMGMGMGCSKRHVTHIFVLYIEYALVRSVCLTVWLPLAVLVQTEVLYWSVVDWEPQEGDGLAGTDKFTVHLTSKGTAQMLRLRDWQSFNCTHAPVNVLTGLLTSRDHWTHRKSIYFHFTVWPLGRPLRVPFKLIPLPLQFILLQVCG